MSQLENLSHIDFEDLCRDIISEHTGERFSAFGPGPDGGIDGRHSKGNKVSVLQCKHYIRSTYSSLKASLVKEEIKVSIIKPKKYYLFTSQTMSPTRVKEICEIMNGSIKEKGDIWGKEDIEQALRKYPEIHKSHIKLWLSSTAVLERILQSGLEQYTQAKKEEIIEALRVYVQNPSLDKAAKKLERDKVLIISGPPGVGKTTLAKIITYNYLQDGWKFYAINSLEEGFSKISDSKKTIFFFDDFLGRVELDRQALLQKDSALATFVKRISASDNARFILTTRAHIFEEARRISDYVDDPRFQLAKFILDVGAYTREIKAKIFFNHLSASKMGPSHVAALMDKDWLKKIVDHKNYNPRIIAFVSSECVEDVGPDEYPKYIYKALENPDLIWSKPYQSLEMRSRNLLVAIFFGGGHWQSIEKVRINFQGIHKRICSDHNQPTKPEDFEEALKSLETGFISISGKTVDFVNPSVRDFLKSYLTDLYFLRGLPESAQRADWAANLWAHIKEVSKLHESELSDFANLFESFSERIGVTPTGSSIIKPYSKTPDDLPLSGRVEFLLDLYSASNNKNYLDRCVEILESKFLEIITDSDANSLPEIHWNISNIIKMGEEHKNKILALLEERVLEIVEDGLSIDELVLLVESVKEFMPDAPEAIAEGIDEAVDYELHKVEDSMKYLDTEEDISQHIEYLEALGQATGVDFSTAIRAATKKLDQCVPSEPSYYGGSPTSSGSRMQPSKFDDDSLVSLFSNLL